MNSDPSSRPIVGKWRRIRRWTVGTCLVIVIFFCVVSWWIGGSLVKSANRSVGKPPVGFLFESTVLSSESGSKIATWRFPAQGSTATVILVHSIRSDRGSMLSRARLFREAGYDVVMIDLQAHGESQGESITMGYLEKHDVRAAVEYVRMIHHDHKIAIVGRSLGGASALLAGPLDIDAMVLESVYPTISQAIHNRISMRMGQLHHFAGPVLITQLWLRLGISSGELRPIDHIEGCGCAVLILAGDQDRHTPMKETREMFEAASCPKELVVFEGAGHVDFHSFDSAGYESTVLSFLELHFGTTFPADDPSNLNEEDCGQDYSFVIERMNANSEMFRPVTKFFRQRKTRESDGARRGEQASPLWES